ncbi:ribosomal protein S7 domain-containing protein [Crassisporium funariophilum]|nr:ribosomal protein S7 domain-containing protein [Crassisporium funariophilum]
MLAQTARRRLPQLFQRHARPISSGGSLGRDRETRNDAMSLFGLDGLGELTEEVDISSLLPPPPPATEPTNLDNMHHHIPPARDPILQFITTLIMTDGKFARAAKTTTQMLLHIQAFTRMPPMPIVRQAVLDASPAVRCLTYKQGGKAIPRPVALSERQRTRAGITWILKSSDAKPGRTLAERLAREMISVIKGDSKALENKVKQHQFAMVNRGVLPKR